ncbi:MAG: hydroxylamine reductase, partial [Okeania sp. SIO3B3]|nr:hydroxylamine reductase [Okeania sp. SIO3B3]
MFCEQCEQTASGQGCHQWGACGKSPELNAIQDLLVYCLRGLAEVRLRAKELNITTRQIDVFICESIFATMTNVNFNKKSFAEYIKQAIAHRENLKTKIQQTNTSIQWSALANYQPDYTESLSLQGENASLKFITHSGSNIDIFSLKLTVIYGIKGVASYNFHAQELGEEDEKIYDFIAEVLVALDNPDLTLDDWVNLALKVGEINLKTMELLE